MSLDLFRAEVLQELKSPKVDSDSLLIDAGTVNGDNDMIYIIK